MTATFAEAIRDIYRVHPDHIFPFIGGRYLDPDPAHLRVLALGINAYVQDGQRPNPNWFASWFGKAMYRF